MSRDAALNKGAIRAQFQELADLLEEEVDVYLIGGGALTLQELKNATKDIDLIINRVRVKPTKMVQECSRNRIP